MSLFDQLFVAHLLGDWVLQTEWQAKNKRHNLRALVSHLILYHIPVAIVLISGYGLADPGVYFSLGFLVLTHAVLDRNRVVEGLVRGLRISTEQPPPRLLSIMTDQTLHMLLLAAVASFLSVAHRA